MLRWPATVFVFTLITSSVVYGYVQHSQPKQTLPSTIPKQKTSSPQVKPQESSRNDALVNPIREESAQVQFTGLIRFADQGRVEGVGTLTIDPTGRLYFQNNNYYIDEQGNISVRSVSSGKYSYEGDISIVANRSDGNTKITIVNEAKGYEANLKLDGSIDVGGSRVTFASGERIDAKKDDTLRLTTDGDIMLVLGDTEGGKALKIYDETGKEKVFEVDSNGNLDAEGTGKFDDKLTVKSGGASITGTVSLDGDTTIGDASTDVLTLNSRVGSDIVPSLGSTYSLGSLSNPFDSIYADTLIATSTEIAGTKAESFTLDTDNTGGNLSLIFGTIGNEQLYWNSTSNRFQMTDDLYVENNFVIAGTQFDAGSVTAFNLGAATIDFNGAGTHQYATGSVFKIQNDSGNAVFATDTSNNLTLGSATTTTSIQSSDWGITSTGVGTGFDSWTVDSLIFNGTTVGLVTDTDLLSLADSALTVNGSAYITGTLRDSANSAGLSGYYLQSSGTGTSWTQLSLGNQLLPSGIEGQTLYNNGGVWTASSGLYYDDVNGRVGIGTTGPAFPLDINGVVNATRFRVNQWAYIDNTAGTAILTLFGNGSAQMGLGYGDPSIRLHSNSSINGALSLGSSYAGTAGPSNGLIVQGNVGIGSTSPNDKLEVLSTSDAQLRLAYDTSNYQALQVASDGGLNWSALGTDADLNFNFAGATDGDFSVNTDDLFVDTSTGRVGIGTASPGVNLSIYQNAPTADQILLRVGTSDAVTRFSVDEDGDVTVGLDLSVNRTINASGYVYSPFYYATSNAGYLWWGDIDTSLSHPTADTLSLVTGGVERFRVDNVGNVGIGSTTFGTSAAKVLALAGSTAPSTAITDGIQLFAVDQSGSHELRVMDEAANITTLSPHNFSLIEDGPSEDMAWSFYSERGDIAVNADMTKALRLIEALTGEKLIYQENILTGESIPYNNSYEALKPKSINTTATETEGVLGSQTTQAQPSSDLTTSTILELLKDLFKVDEVLTFLKETVFSARAIFKEDVVLEKDLKVDGVINSEAINVSNLNVDRNTAGTVVVPKGVSSTTITFYREFSNAPLIQLTPLTKVQGNYWIEEVTQKGFAVKFDESQAEETRFNWFAVTSSDNSELTGESPDEDKESPIEPTIESSQEEEPSATETTAPESTPSIELNN